MDSTQESGHENAVEDHRRRWKRRRRSLWRRLFGRSTIIVWVTIAVTFALFTFLSQNIGRSKEPD